MKINGNGPLKDCVLEFNGNMHKLNIVIAKAGSAPVIDLKLADVDVKPSLDARTQWHEVDGLEPAVIKHNGKFQVLLGRDRVLACMTQETVKARLITSVALKDARIIKDVPTPDTTPIFPAAPFNPPRFTNNRPQRDGGYRRGDAVTHSNSNARYDSASYPSNGQRPPPRSSTPTPYSDDQRKFGDRVSDGRQPFKKEPSVARSYGGGRPSTSHGTSLSKTFTKKSFP